jgi:flagellar secretion chaperone FliS
VLTYHKKQANLQSYRDTEVSTSNRLKLLVMLYEGAIRFCAQAAEAMHDGNVGTKGEMISKALAIINELQSTLDHSQAPDVAGNLERLYEFINDRLVTANLENNLAALMDAVRVIKILHSAWVEVAEKPQADLVTAKPAQARELKRRAADGGAAADSYVRISV